MFVSVTGGHIVACRFSHTEERSVNTYFTLEDVKNGMLKKFFQKWNVENVQCSSTVDFPEDGGLPGVAVRLMVEEALGWKEDLFMKNKLRFAETVLNGIVANTKDYNGRPWTYLAADAAADIREVLEKAKVIGLR